MAEKSGYQMVTTQIEGVQKSLTLPAATERSHDVENGGELIRADQPFSSG